MRVHSVSINVSDITGVYSTLPAELLYNKFKKNIYKNKCNYTPSETVIKHIVASRA